MWHMAGPLKNFNSSWLGAHWKRSDGAPKFTSKQEKIRDQQYFLNFTYCNKIIWKHAW